MSPGERIHGGAQLVVSRTKAVPEHMRSLVREISRVETAPADRRKGHASELLRQVCAEADKRGMLLLLQCRPYGDGGMDADRLECWYAAFGFVPMPGGDGVMARPVGGKWRAPTPTVKPIVEAIHG